MLAKKESWGVPIPIGRLVAKAIIDKGLPDKGVDNERWLLARDTEAILLREYHRHKEVSMGDSMSVMLPSEDAVLMVIDKLKELESEDAGRRIWRERKQLEIYLSGSKSHLISERRLSIKAVKQKAEKMTELMIRRCVKEIRKLIPDLKDMPLPNFECDWGGQRKKCWAGLDEVGRYQYPGLIDLAMLEIVDVERDAASSDTRIEMMIDRESGRKGIMSDRWEAHLIIEICTLMTSLARLHILKKKNDEMWSYKSGEGIYFTYGHLRKVIAEELFKSMPVTEVKDN